MGRKPTDSDETKSLYCVNHSNQRKKTLPKLSTSTKEKLQYCMLTNSNHHLCSQIAKKKKKTVPKIKSLFVQKKKP
jgi:hypothetical protein